MSIHLFVCQDVKIFDMPTDKYAFVFTVLPPRNPTCYITACVSHLQQPEMMLMLSAGRLLQAAARGSELACARIVRAAVPLLLGAYGAQKHTTPRHNVIVVINGFLSVTMQYAYDDESSMFDIKS